MESRQSNVLGSSALPLLGEGGSGTELPPPAPSLALPVPNAGSKRTQFISPKRERQIEHVFFHVGE